MWRYKIQNISGVHSISVEGITFTQNWQYFTDRLYLLNDKIIEENVDEPEYIGTYIEPLPIITEIPEKDQGKEQIQKNDLISQIIQLDINHVHDDFELQNSSISRLNKILKEFK